MLYHQNIFEKVKLGSCFFARSQIFSDKTSLFDCFQNFTSQSIRSYHPLPTMPWPDGNFPVMYVDCTAVVTAGSMGVMVPMVFPSMYFFKKGVCSPMSDEDSPTISMTTVLFMKHFLYPLQFSYNGFLQRQAQFFRQYLPRVSLHLHIFGERFFHLDG